MGELKAYSYIRFSSPAQEKGDSLRRQIEQSEEYAKTHGLILDDSLRFTDRGLSAYKGFHRIKGALGKFIKLVEAGKIDKGSILIVENLDRLSREHVLDALSQFNTIIQAGIRLVTLQDGQEYTRESINRNWTQLIISITYMARAHEESLTKSKRLKAAWANKRNQATNGNRKLTSRCPAWLELSKDKKSFKVLLERAQVIRLIFEMKLSGKGSGHIEQELNRMSIWKPKNGWRKSYIQKLLHNNRALIGEYQLYIMDAGKRVPEGDPISDYFPSIIDKKLFDRVQGVIQHNRRTNGNAGGRTGTINNLFGHIARCKKCGGPMAYLNKGPKPKGGQYLQCDRARRGLGCIKQMIRYDQFEELTLTHCKGLNAQDILPDNEKLESELSVLHNQLQANEGELSELQGQISNVLNSIATTESRKLRKVLEEKADLMLTHEEALEKEKSNLKTDIEKLTSSGQDTEQQLQSIRELITLLAESKDQERINLRLNLRDRLRMLIDHINVYPLGVMRAVMETKAKEHEGVKAKLEKGDYDSSPIWAIHFKTGDIREISLHEPHLTFELDAANEVAYSVFKNGEVDIKYFGKREEERRRKEKRVNEKIRIRARKKTRTAVPTENSARLES